MRRPAGAVYHFLLPDPGMAAYADKAAKALEPEHFARIREWRKHFFRPFADEQIAELEALSDCVDDLWALHAEQLARDRRETEDTLPVWGRRAAGDERRTANTWKDRIRAQGVFGADTRTVGPYRRLKLVMDYWCALWFWPIRAAGRMPDRDEFLNEVTLVLTGSVYQPGVGPGQTADLFGAEYAAHADDIAKRITNEVGMLDLGKAVRAVPAPAVRGRVGAAPPLPPLGARLRRPVLRRAGRRIRPRRLRPRAREPAVDQGDVGRSGRAGRPQPRVRAAPALGGRADRAARRRVRALPPGCATPGWPRWRRPRRRRRS